MVGILDINIITVFCANFGDDWLRRFQVMLTNYLS